jgi:hypothetical protein
MPSDNPTNIAALWNPQIWVQGAAEQMRTLPSVITSGLAVRSGFFDALASGGGTTVNIPAFHDSTDADDHIQVENTPAVSDALRSLQQIAVMCNREKRWDVTALAAQVSGSDPVRFIMERIGMNRLKNRQKSLISILRGIFGVPGGANGVAAGSLYDITANGGGIGSDNLIRRTTLTATLTLLGELADAVIDGGIMICHPVIREALTGQNTSIALLPADNALVIERYGGLQVFSSNALVTTVGGIPIYETFVSRKGTFAWGEKPQAGDVIDVASLQMFADKPSNNTFLFDRTRHILHPNGCKWIGVPAGSSPTNVELQNAANWQYEFDTIDRLGIVSIRSNG